MKIFEVYDTPSEQLAKLRAALLSLDVVDLQERALLEAIDDEMQERQRSDLLAGNLETLQCAEDIRCNAATRDADSVRAFSGASTDSIPAAPCTVEEKSPRICKQNRNFCVLSFRMGHGTSEAVATDQDGCTPGPDTDCCSTQFSSCAVTASMDVAAFARQAFKFERIKTCQALKALTPAVRSHASEEAGSRADRRTATHAITAAVQSSSRFSDYPQLRFRAITQKDSENHVGTVQRHLQKGTPADPVPRMNNHGSLQATDYEEPRQGNHCTPPQCDDRGSAADGLGMLDPSQGPRWTSDASKDIEIMSDHDSALHTPLTYFGPQTELVSPVPVPETPAKMADTHSSICRPPMHPCMPHTEVPQLCDGSDREHIDDTGVAASQVICKPDVVTSIEVSAYTNCSSTCESHPQHAVEPEVMDAGASDMHQSSPAGSSLVLEDSFTDSNERGCIAAAEQHASEGAGTTHVELAGDMRKMEAPTWTCFTAVEALTGCCTNQAAVSPWAGVATDRCVAGSSGQLQPESPEEPTATGRDMAFSPSARYWLDQQVGCNTSKSKGKTYTLGAGRLPAAQPVASLQEQAEDHGVGASQPGLSRSNKPMAASYSISKDVTTALEHKIAVDKRNETHQSLILRDLSLRHFADWKTRRPSSPPSLTREQSTAQTGATVISSKDQVKVSMAGTKPEVPKSTRDSVQVEAHQIAHKLHADTSSYGRSAVGSRNGRCTGYTTPVRAMDQQNGMLASVPAIGSLSDLSRGQIPQLPQVYTAIFPEFDSVSSLFWKLQYSRTKQRLTMDQRQYKPEHDAMLIDSYLDHMIDRCEAWCTVHGPHGLVHPDSGNESITGRHAGKTSTQLTRSEKDLSAGGAQLGKPRTHSRYDNMGQEALCTATGSDTHKGRCIDPVEVAVPGWVPQIPTALTQQRWYCIVAGKDHPEVTEIVGTSLHALGWKQDESCKRTGPGGCVTSAGEPHLWNLCWTWSARARVPDALLTWQRVNHFQECRHLTRKDLLKHHLQRHAAMFQNSRHVAFFQCMPTTFTLPREYEAFEHAFRHVASPGKCAPTGDHVKQVEVLPHQKNGLNLWILKPSSLSRGRGIYLLDELGATACSQPCVVQRYIADPFLYQGLKFDLRLYVLVTSFHPLETFLYKEGFARFALVPYTTAAQHRGNTAIHLTNSTIQAEEAQIEQALPEFLKPNKRHRAGASKMSLSRLWPLLIEKGVDQERLWKDIRVVVLAALYSAKESIPRQINAFELYGFDVMFDQHMKVWLLEVNASPSLGFGTELDQQIKSQLIKDVITLVNPLPFDRLALAHVLKRRKQQRTGPARKSRRQGGGLLAGTEAEEREVLNADLHAILKGARVRAVGDMPLEVGNFERVAPCSLLEQFQRMQRT